MAAEHETEPGLGHQGTEGGLAVGTLEPHMRHYFLLGVRHDVTRCHVQTHFRPPHVQPHHQLIVLRLRKQTLEQSIEEEISRIGDHRLYYL